MSGGSLHACFRLLTSLSALAPHPGLIHMSWSPPPLVVAAASSTGPPQAGQADGGAQRTAPGGRSSGSTRSTCIGAWAQWRRQGGYN